MAGAAGNPARGSTEGRAFRRVVLKLSGEVLAGEDKQGINVKIIRGLAEEIRDIHREGVEMAIVIGGGNIFRGVKAASDGMDRAIGDYMGMMATVINGLALQDFLEKEGLTTRLQTAIEIKSVAEPFIRRKAIRHLEKKRIVILSGGTGNPYFTTDTTAALRAVEINADVIFKATKVDGVYSDDPVRNPHAERFPEITYDEMLSRNLQVMDAQAIHHCREHNIPVIVFNYMKTGSIERAIAGERFGTRISSGR